MAENKALALLRYHNLLIIVETIYKYDNQVFEEMAHLYESKMCPPDCISEVVSVVDLENMDADPHGIFEFIGLVKRPEIVHHITSDNIKLLVAEHLEKLKPITL